MSKHIVLVYLTLSDEAMVHQFSKDFLEKKWVACINIFPKTRAMYEWQGQMKCEESIVMILKTRRHHLSDLKKYVQQHHDDDCPCFMVLSVDDGLDGFLSWIKAQTEC